VRRDGFVQLLSWASSTRVPVIVGNGLLAREIYRWHDSSNLLYLFGGMGLASSVAAGLIAGGAIDSTREVVVLEGDGNFLMGLQGAAMCARLSAPVLHVVDVNGVYATTGGQELPSHLSSPADICRLGRALGYRQAHIAKTAFDIESAISNFQLTRSGILVALDFGAGSERNERPPLSQSQAVVRFMKALNSGFAG